MGRTTGGEVYNSSSNISGVRVGTFIGIGAITAETSIVITSNGKFAYIGGTVSTTPVTISYTNLEQSSNGFNANPTAISLGITSVAGRNTYLALTPDGKYLYAVYSNKLSVISTATNTLVGGGTNVTLTDGSLNIVNASGIAISPDGTKAFVVDRNTDNVLPIAITAGTGVPVITAHSAFTVGTYGLGNLSLAFIPSGATVYIASDDGHLYPVNATTNAVGTGIFLAAGIVPNSTSITPNGKTAYVVSGTNSFGTVYVVNLTTQSVSTIAMPGNRAFMGALTPDGSLLYVTNTLVSVVPAFIAVVNTASNTVNSTTLPGPSSLNSAIAIANVSSGTLDTTFGNNGFTLTPVSRADTVQNAAVRPSPYDTDEILVTGGTFANSTSSLFLSQYTASGFLDTSGFNSGGSTPGYQRLLPTGSIASTGNAVTTDSSGNVLVAGYSAQNPTAMVLARYTSAGVLDTTFPNGSGPGYALLTIGEGFTANAIGLQSSGNIVVAGTCVLNGIPLFAIARFSSAGVLDTTFGPGSNGFVTSSFGNISILKGITIPTTSSAYADNIFAVGGVDNQALIAQYDTNGNLQQSLLQPLRTANFKPITPSSSIAYAVVWDPNSAGTGQEEFYMVGSAVINGITQAVLMAYQPNGSSVNALDAFFNFQGLSSDTGGYVLQPVANGSEYYSVALDSNGNIVCGGYAIGNLANQLLLVRYFGFSWENFGGANNAGELDWYFNNNNIQLMTIGSTTAAQGVGVQSTNNMITAGTADGTFCVARFNQ